MRFGSSTSVLLASIVLILLTGCAEESVRVRATADLDCGSARISVRGRNGEYLAQGCGRMIRYDCYRNVAGHTLCLPQSRVEEDESTAAR